MASLNFIDGEVLLVDKPGDISSFGAVNRLKRAFISKTKKKRYKIGHAGTLDPLATGLLIICIGKQTKKISEYQNQLKTYTGKFKLGETTPSYDGETEVNEVFNYDHIKELDLKNLSKQFIGKKMQKPPIFSAIKKDGKRMYEYARENKKIEIQEREIQIHEFNITNFSSPYVEFYIKCSKGTYIRSIANDYGEKLNSGSYLFELRRVNIGDYSVLNALKIE